MHERETYTGRQAVFGSTQRFETIENLFYFFGSDTSALISDGYGESLVETIERHLYAFPVGCIFKGVGEKIEKNFFDFIGIGVASDRLRRSGKPIVDVLFLGHVLERFEGVS